MTSPAETKFRLLHQFGDFYGEIFRLQQLARDGSDTVEQTPPTGAPRNDGSGGGETPTIRASVAELLERKAAEDNRIDDGAAAEAQRELLYLMTAVADDIFTRLQWPGREHWQANPLEQQLFDSNIAGERIFGNIDAVLVRQDEAAGELATVYLAALVIGFRGKYGEEDASEAIETYRQRLETALTPLREQPRAKSAPAPPRSDPAQRKIVLSEPTRQPLRFPGAPEPGTGAGSGLERGATVSRRHPITLGACVLTAVLAFAIGGASGLLISARMRGASQEPSAGRQAPAARAALSSGQPGTNSQKSSSGPAAAPSAERAHQILSPPSGSGAVKDTSTASPENPHADLSGATASPSLSAAPRVISFTVQVGSFRTQQNAQRLAESLKDLGYQPEIQQVAEPDARPWHIVRVGPYKDWRMATNVADKLSSDQDLGVEPLVRLQE